MRNDSRPLIHCIFRKLLVAPERNPAPFRHIEVLYILPLRRATNRVDITATVVELVHQVPSMGHVGHVDPLEGV